MSRKPRHIECTYTTWGNKLNFPQHITQKWQPVLLWIREIQRFVVLLGFFVVFKHFCDEILEDTPLMASHWRKLKSLGQTSWSVSGTDIHKGRLVPEGSFPQFMANCHISLSLFLSFKQRKIWLQLWKYLPHTLGEFLPYFMGNDPSREQMRQHDPFSAGEAKRVWVSENKMTHQSVLLLRIFIGIPSCVWFLPRCICYLWQPNSLKSPKRAKYTITSTLNLKNHPHYTSVRAHWHLGNTALSWYTSYCIT